MTRRTFIWLASLLAVGLGLVVALPLRFAAQLPVYEAWLDRHLSEGLRGLLAASGASVPALPLARLSRERAIRKLVSGISHRRLLSILSDHDALLAHVERLQAEDLRERKLETLGGWVLSETEVCVAVLVGS